MAITFVTFALSGTTDSTTLNITLPTVQAGDVMLLEYTHRGTGTGTLGGVGGSDWNNKFSRTYNTTMSAHCYWKRCDGSESGDALTVTGLTNSCAGCVTLYRGCVASGDPIEAGASEENASANETHAAITTLTNLAWVVLTVANTPDLAVTSPSTTSPGALTQRAERLNTTGTDSSICHNSAEKAGAGTTGSLTWAQTDGVSASFAYALQPDMPAIAVPVGTLAAVGLAVGVAFLGPTVGSLALTGYAPTVLAGQTIAMPAGALALSGTTPVLGRGMALPPGILTLTGTPPVMARGLALPVGTLTLSGQAPTVGSSSGIALPAGTVTLTGAAPTVRFGPSHHIQMLAGQIELASTFPDITFSGGAPAGAITLTGYAPTVAATGGGAVSIPVPAGGVALVGQTVGVAFGGPPVGAITLTGYAPTVSISGGTATIPVPAGTLTLTGLAPSAALGGVGIAVPVGALTLSGQYVAVAFMDPAAGTITLTGYAPTVLTGGVARAMPAGTLTLTGAAPILARAISLPVGTLTLTGLAPSVVPAGTIAPQAGTLTLTGYAPSVARALAVPVGTLTLTGYAPSLVGGGTLAVPAGTLTLTGRVPTLSQGRLLAVPLGSVTLTGHAPGVSLGVRVAVPAGAITFSSAAPSLNPPTVRLVPSGALLLTGRVPVVVQAPTPVPGVATADVIIDIRPVVGMIDVRPVVGVIDIRKR